MNNTRQYTKESLHQDIDYLAGHGLDESEAEKFILYLLECEPAEGVEK